ncbi:MAG: hybrid sensor histidine kinase/response regulator [Caldilineaceae bacterium]
MIDDNPTNIDVVFSYLAEHGYKVFVAENGRTALSRAKLIKPDLILLDVMMPDINGLEICRRLKEDETTKATPIIFMTALTDPEDIVHGLQAGAVDYITKPIQYEVMLARISTHLNLRKLQLELQIANQELIERNQELDAYAGTLAHKMRSPLSAVLLYTNALQRCAHLPENHSRYPARISDTVTQIIKLTDDLLFLARIKDAPIALEPCDIGQIVQTALDRLQPMVALSQAEISYPATWPPAQGHTKWICEVWHNLISNAIQYGGAPPKIELGYTEQPNGDIRFWVRDNGKGIPLADQAQMFTNFTRLDPEKAQGYGLGLSIVKRIISKIGGDVGVDSVIGEGSTFYFSLAASARVPGEYHIRRQPALQ